MRRDRCGADQPPTAALSDHLPRRGLVAVQDTRHVHVDRLPPLSWRDLQQRSRHRDAGIRDHHVQAAEMPNVLGHRRVHAGCIGHIHRKAEDSLRSAQIVNRGVHLVLGGR